MPVPSQATLGSLVKWTVGLAATFVSVACIIAADTGAYFVGKALGRTKLTDISPRKTVEGAIGGLVSSVLVALGLYKVAGWPASPLAAAGLGVSSPTSPVPFMQWAGVCLAHGHQRAHFSCRAYLLLHTCASRVSSFGHNHACPAAIAVLNIVHCPLPAWMCLGGWVVLPI